MARNRDGRLTVAYSAPVNAYGRWAIATLRSPRELRTAGSVFEWGSASMGCIAGANLLKEFRPYIRGIFHKKQQS